MPPRLALPRQTTRPTFFLFPFLHQPSPHCRYASILGSLSDTKGAYSKRKRLGRGPASGKGKTSGRGHKGQKQHGSVPAGFQGGQTPDIVVHGERGVKNVHSLDLARINVDRIQAWIDQGRLDITRPITVKELHKSRCTHGIKDGVKLLARNAEDLRSPIHITVSRASATAIAAVEAAGGSVTTRYYTRTSIRRVIGGESHPILSLLSQPPPWLMAPPTAASSLQTPHTVTTAAYSTQTSVDVDVDVDVDSPDANTETYPSTPLSPIISKAGKEDLLQSPALAPLVAEIQKYKYRLPDPAGRKDLEYYRDPAHRGYLSYQLQPGQGPSLFFKPPTDMAAGGAGRGVGKVRTKRAKTENKLW